MNNPSIQDRKRFIANMNTKWERKYENYRKWLMDGDEFDKRPA